MKLIALGPATRLGSREPQIKAVVPGREIVPVQREVRRDYSTVLSESAGTLSRGSLVDLLA